MIELLLINSDENMNSLAEMLLREHGVDLDKVFYATDHEQAHSELDRLDKQESKALLVVSSEIFSNGRYKCTSDVIRAALGKQHYVLILSGRRCEHLSLSLQEMIGFGVPYVQRDLTNVSDPKAFYNILKAPFIVRLCRILKEHVNRAGS